MARSYSSWASRSLAPQTRSAARRAVVARIFPSTYLKTRSLTSGKSAEKSAKSARLTRRAVTVPIARAVAVLGLESSRANSPTRSPRDLIASIVSAPLSAATMHLTLPSIST